MSTAPNDQITIVSAFHDRLNARDVDGVLALATEDVRVGGPRGSGQGKDLLREWVDRASITMTPIRWFAGPNMVVVEQSATWVTAASGEPDMVQTVATAFTMLDGLIAGIARYTDIGEAVIASGLDEDNEIPAPS